MHSKLPHFCLKKFWIQTLKSEREAAINYLPRISNSHFFSTTCSRFNGWFVSHGNGLLWRFRRTKSRSFYLPNTIEMVDFSWLCQFTGVYTHVLTGNEKTTVPIGIAESACFSAMKSHGVSDLHPIGVHSSKLNSSPLKMVGFQ